MITASGLADALTSAFLTRVQAGDDRPVRDLELLEACDGLAAESGDLVLALGARDLDEVAQLVQRARDASGLVLRYPWTDDVAIRQMCSEVGLPLLAVARDATWSSVISLLRNALDHAASARSLEEATTHVYQDLFEIADTISSILGAPVTIEDAASRVLAYSSGQNDVDQARMSTIVGRQVPREVRDHFRALGVFRRLVTSDSPIFVPAGEGGVKPRYVVPIRAGGEWLGSVWAVTETPVVPERSNELRAATAVVALYLLRMRAQGELQQQVHLDQVRTAVRGDAAARPDWLASGPWRVAILAGPSEGATPEVQCQLWQALSLRRGWRRPLIANIGTSVYAVLREEGAEAGTWSWLCDFVREQNARNPRVRVVAGGPVGSSAELGRSREAADELATLDLSTLDQPIASVDNAWADLVLARAVSGLSGRSLVSPLVNLINDEHRNGGNLVMTLGAVLDYWGEPRRAATTLGVHPNTVRYRMAQVADRCPVDLTDPAQRLALRLEIAEAQAKT